MIVLDTHIWIWWVNDSPRLTEPHKKWIQDYQAQGLGVSIISCWEVAKLVEKNRLILSIPVDEWLQTALTYPGVQLLNLTVPCLSYFSRYSKVLEADGNPMRVRTALQIINFYIDEFLNEQEREFDPDTRWALTWFEQYQIKGLEEAGILLAKNGKVRLLKREKLPESWNPAKDDRPKGLASHRTPD